MAVATGGVFEVLHGCWTGPDRDGGAPLGDVAV